MSLTFGELGKAWVFGGYCFFSVETWEEAELIIFFFFSHWLNWCKFHTIVYNKPNLWKWTSIDILLEQFMSNILSLKTVDHVKATQDLWTTYILHLSQLSYKSHLLLFRYILFCLIKSFFLRSSLVSKTKKNESCYCHILKRTKHYQLTSQ